VVELGAGVGATALALLAHVNVTTTSNQSKNNIQHIYVTDYTRACMDNLQHNLDINQTWLQEQQIVPEDSLESASPAKARISARTLDWTWFDPDNDTNPENATIVENAKTMLEESDVLLAADVAYDPSVLGSLANTIKYFLSSHTPSKELQPKLALLATTRRNLKTFQLLEQELTERGIIIERVHAIPNSFKDHVLFPSHFHQPRSDVWFTKLTVPKIQ